MKTFKIVLLVMVATGCMAYPRFNLTILRVKDSNTPLKEDLIEAYAFTKKSFEDIGVDIKLKRLVEVDNLPATRHYPDIYSYFNSTNGRWINYRLKHNYRRSIYYVAVPPYNGNEIGGLAFDICNPYGPASLAIGAMYKPESLEGYYYLKVLMAHEIGHLVGLVHNEDNEPNIMKPYLHVDYENYRKTGMFPQFKTSAKYAVKRCKRKR